MLAYCTPADLDRFLSAEGVIAFADHDRDGLGDADVVDDAIVWASAQIDLYLLQRYHADDLAADRMIRHWCKIMACRFLCSHRGNGIPESIELEYQEITAADGLLKQVLKGVLRLSVPRKVRDSATFSNLTVDRRYRHEKLRVVRQVSDNEPTKRERDTYVHGGAYRGR